MAAGRAGGAQSRAGGCARCAQAQLAPQPSTSSGCLCDAGASSNPASRNRTRPSSTVTRACSCSRACCASCLQLSGCQAQKRGMKAYIGGGGEGGRICPGRGGWCTRNIMHSMLSHRKNLLTPLLQPTPGQG